MGHMLKNTKFRSGSYALGLPVGSSSIGPDAPTVGQTRWNTSTSKFEFYTGTVWLAVAHEGNVTIVQDGFTGNALLSDYGPMSYSYQPGDEAQVLVFNGAVFQIPGTNYTFYGNTTIHFTGAVSEGAAITILHNYGSTVAS